MAQTKENKISEGNDLEQIKCQNPEVDIEIVTEFLKFSQETKSNPFSVGSNYRLISPFSPVNILGLQHQQSRLFPGK